MGREIMNTAIPESLKNDIQNVVSDLKNKLGGDLKSIVLYGGLVKNELVKDTDRVSLMLVVSASGLNVLDNIADAVIGKRAHQIQVTILTPAELQSSMDVFPIKFLDMKQDYEVLAGEDFVKGLEISRDNLRLRCEQEIKNLMLKFRRMYIYSRDNPEALKGILLRGYYSFLQSGDALAELKTGKTYRKEAEIIEAIGYIGLDAELLKSIAKLRSGVALENNEAVRNSAEKFMRMIEKASQMADEM